MSISDTITISLLIAIIASITLVAIGCIISNLPLVQVSACIFFASFMALILACTYEY